MQELVRAAVNVISRPLDSKPSGNRQDNLYKNIYGWKKRIERERNVWPKRNLPFEIQSEEDGALAGEFLKRSHPPVSFSRASQLLLRTGTSLTAKRWKEREGERDRWEEFTSWQIHSCCWQSPGRYCRASCLFCLSCTSLMVQVYVFFLYFFLKKNPYFKEKKFSFCILLIWYIINHV